MKYKESNEILSKSFFILDGDEEYAKIAAQVISKYTKIPANRIETLIMVKGLKALFDNPSLVGANDEQIILLSEIEELVDWGFDDTYESI